MSINSFILIIMSFFTPNAGERDMSTITETNLEQSLDTALLSVNKHYSDQGQPYKVVLSEEKKELLV